MGYENLLKHALILDTETLGLQRGMPIHEVAMYNFDTKEAYEYLLKPRMAVIEGSAAQDLTRLASSAMDVHRAVDFPDWRTAIQEVTAMSLKTKSSQLATDAEIQKALEYSNPFLYKALYSPEGSLYPHLSGVGQTEMQRKAREAVLRKHGISLSTQANVEIAQLLAPGELIKHRPGLTQGQTVWIANAGFESKQLGAQLGAMGPDAVEAFKKNLETRSAYADPLYVTGKEVNDARVAAQLTGDWTNVWKSYKQFTPKAGEVAVRDIQDVSRAMMSYGKNLGLMKPGKDYYGASVDLQYRLLGSLEMDPHQAQSMLLSQETHRAVEDAAISEKYVLERSLHYTEALQAVSENTPYGQRLLQEAQSGKGALHEASLYFKRLETVAPVVQRINLVKRLERAALDINSEGVTYQMTGYKGIHRMEQTTASGEATSLARLRPQRTGFRSMDDVVGYLHREGAYGSDVKGVWEQMQNHISQATTTQKTKEAAIVESALIETTGEKGVNSFFQKNARQLLNLSSQTEMQQLGSTYGSKIWKYGLEKGIQNAPRAGQAFAMAGVGLASMGAIWALSSGPNSSSEQRKSDSVLTMNYQEWLAYQGQKEGLPEQGMAGQYRKQNTDFGSPYQGPQASQQVFIDQQLLDAREKWMRQQYGASMNDPVNGLFGMNSIFKMIGHSSYTFNNSGRPLEEGELPGIRNRRGMRVMDVDPSQWQMDVEDADTILLKKKGIRGAVSRFFGLGGGEYTFRLEGIDSTETQHDQSYHAPQPFAEQAKTALQAMYSGKKLQIAFDAQNMTYGRNVGVVYSDGKNLNLEEVKQGIAEHLPYGKAKDAHVDWNAFAFAQEKAIASNRGMWSTPWAQVYSQFSQQNNQQITFDTFAKTSKIANNYKSMQLLSVMEQAQAQGFVNDNQIALAQDIGKTWNMHGDKATPFLMEAGKQAHYTNYMSQMMTDQKNFMNTYGTNSSAGRFSHTDGSGTLNAYLALDTMGSSTSPWARRSLNSFDRYGSPSPSQARRMKMAAGQRQVNQSFGQSPIGHTRM
jgi:endonuclease YncB( thermonuclease family)